MTTITGATARTKPADRLLRITLRVDAIASGVTGLAFLGTPKILPAALTAPTGVFLLLFAAGVFLAATPRKLNAAAVITIIVLNIAWVVASIVTLAAGLLPLTGLGVGFVIVQAVAVAALAEIEFIGLRRIGR